ncbi:hypothetical protein KSD_04360 [Ktedonobacter sp. SOSP1-85]|nr:hypothetical protein KSD_04360 [Ktedonobacter sp. SOSP1-85]
MQECSLCLQPTLKAQKNICFAIDSRHKTAIQSDSPHEAGILSDQRDRYQTFIAKVE